MAASKKQQNEERDALGYTLWDYFDMQRLKDKKGIAGDSLVGAFDVTDEQIRLINSGDRILRKIAADCFYFANLRLIRKMAYVFLQNNKRLKTIVSYEDLIQQLYVDLCCGYVKLNTDKKKLLAAIYDCFKLAAIGGLGVLVNDIQ